MDVVQINGSGDLSGGARRAHASDKSDHARLVPAPAHGAKDSATISADARDTLQNLRTLVDRLRQGDAPRDEVVDRARAALASGALDTADVYRATADALLRDLVP